MKNKKKTICVVVAFISLALVITLALLYFTGPSVSHKSGGVVYESSTDITNKTPKGDAVENKKIAFPGYTKKIIKYSAKKPMSFQNPRSNNVDFVYTVFYEEKEIYKSEVIKPGQTSKWYINEILKEKGKYEVTILITPYSMDGSVKNGFKQSINVKIA